MRTRISCKIWPLLHISHESDIFDGLRSKAMADNPDNWSDLVNDILFKLITHEPRITGLVQQGPGEANLWVVFRS